MSELFKLLNVIMIIQQVISTSYVHDDYIWRAITYLPTYLPMSYVSTKSNILFSS